MDRKGSKPSKTGEEEPAEEKRPARLKVPKRGTREDDLKTRIRKR